MNWLEILRSVAGLGAVAGYMDMLPFPQMKMVSLVVYVVAEAAKAALNAWKVKNP